MPKLGTIGMIPPYNDPLAEPDCKATDGRARAHGGTLRVIGVVPLGIWEWSMVLELWWDGNSSRTSPGSSDICLLIES